MAPLVNPTPPLEVDDDASQRRGKHLVVRHDDNHSAPLHLIAHEVEESSRTGPIESGGRLIEEKQSGVMHERAGERNPLPLPPRIAANAPIDKRPQIEALGRSATRIGGVTAVETRG